MNRLVATLLVLAAGSAGCTKTMHSAAMHSARTALEPSAPPKPDAASVVATINGKSVTLQEVDEAITPALGQLDRKLQTERFALRKQGLNDLLVMRLVDAEAKKDGMSSDEWIKKHIEASTHEPSVVDAKKFFDENSNSMKGRSFEDEKPRILAYLTEDNRERAVAKVIEELKAHADIHVLLEEPTVHVDPVGPSLGPPNAPVTIVEFSDFQCPFCSRMEPVIKQVMSDYGSKVRFVFRDYPLRFHDHAEKASEASHCADAQGKYWPMHDVLFSNQDKLDVAGLKKLASGVPGMDQGQFDACLDSGRMKDEVAENERAGEAAGVSGTPHFFVNGRSLEGAQPYEELKRVIDHELTKPARTQ